MRPRILLINPNTSDAITSRILALANEECGEHANFNAVTARFGARYISDRASATIAAHAVLDVYAAAAHEQEHFDGVVIACFGDPGREALAERLSAPVVGFAEAGLRTAAQLPGKFIIATSGVAWRDMLTELAVRLELTDHLAGFVLLGPDDRDPLLVSRIIGRELPRLGATRAVLGGTGLIPFIPGVLRQLGDAVIDPHLVAIREAIKLATAARPKDLTVLSPKGTYSGVSDPLTRLLERRSDTTLNPAG